MRPWGVELASPWYLLTALLAIPAVWWSARSAGRVLFSSLRALPFGGQTWRTRLAWIPDALLGLAIVALAIALAGPRKGDQSSRVRRDGIAIMMAVDVSSSMLALDLSTDKRELTRLDAVKQVFEKFVLGGDDLAGRPDDAIGLVAFARYADTRSPLTLDHANLIAAARQLEFAQRHEDGTHIGAALALAVTRLTEFKADDRSVGRVAILLTDGAATVHEIDVDTAIDDAKKAGVKVYTIGAGTEGEAFVRVPRGDGSSYLDRQRVTIDEGLLRKIADATGGAYFRATDHGSLDKIYARISKLTRREIEEDRFTQYRQFYGRFLIVACALILSSLLLRGTVFRRLP